MKSKIIISLPKPCHENWANMSPTEKGKFCNSCNKEVYDFTKTTNTEIINSLKNDTVTCGRFLETQLNKELYNYQQKTSYFSLATLSLLGFLGLGSQITFAQTLTKPKVEANINKNDSINPNLKKLIKGVVSDESGPLIGANVTLIGTEKGTTTDFDGNYEIEVQLGDRILISYIGIEDYEFTVGTKSTYNVALRTTKEFEGTTIVGGGFCVKRTFFGRQLYKVRNWFR